MPQRTPLYARHEALGARMIDFAGWMMPVQYSGTIAEHQAVRQHAGMFDVSHMGLFVFRGSDAERFLQQLTPNDVTQLTDGKAQYSMLLNERGGIEDDVIIYRRSAEEFMMVVNAGNLEHDWHWIMGQPRGELEVSNQSTDTALIALQGPKAATILQTACADASCETIERFAFADIQLGEHIVTAARTGYTGEDGYEIFCHANVAETVWNTLLEAGTPHGLVPCGLAARDTLRLEMAYPLHGNDITAETSPLETRLGWVVKLDAGDFIGASALRDQKATGVNRKLVGFRMQERAIPRHNYAVIHDGKPVGYVTSGSMSPSLGYGVGLAMVPTELAAVGTEFSIDIRGKDRLAEVVKLPFYQPHT